MRQLIDVLAAYVVEVRFDERMKRDFLSSFPSSANRQGKAGKQIKKERPMGGC
jgi:hypothetical protein